MSLSDQNKPEPQRKLWLTGAALWGVVIAWGGLGVWGWTQSAAGPVVAVHVTLSICADVIGARMAVHAGAAGSKVRAAACVALALGCIAWTGFAGKRALELADAQRRAPAEAVQAQRAEANAALARVEADLAAVPAIRSDIPAARLRELQAARVADLARLEPQRAAALARLEAISPPPPTPSPIPGPVLWGAVALTEGLKLFGFWAIGAGGLRGERPAPSNVIPLSPGQALARRRWGAPREA
jgi:hypothetical protein